MGGCSSGVKEKTNYIYVGFAKTSEETNGAVRIATNKLIPVTIMGSKDTASKMNLGGMLAVREADLTALIRAANSKEKK